MEFELSYRLMGVLGAGLYSGDFALDLRSTVKAVLRLPFDPDRLLEILRSTAPSEANSPEHEDHTTFWLIVADQFTRQGVACEQVRDKAMNIINGGADIAALETLGMRAAELRKRQRVLAELKARIAQAPTTSKARTVLGKPQPLLMEIGDVLVYPTCAGKNFNPYFSSGKKNFYSTGREPWRPDGWGAMVILDCGRAFDYLAWYRPATLAESRREKPTLDLLCGAMLWRVELHGTCPASHFRKMELEKIGVLAVDREKAKEVYPSRFGTGLSAAVQDISIANRMKTALPGAAVPNPGGERKGHTPTLSGIASVLLR
jgi:hypothetical protein